MTPMIFAVIFGGAMVLFLMSFYLDKRKIWKDDVLKGVTGVKDQRKRMDTLTDRFVALGNEPLLARAASRTADPVLSRLTGQTLTLYRQLKDHFVALSYAYACGSRAVQATESLFGPKGALKFGTMRRLARMQEDGLPIKEIAPERYTKFVTPGRTAPKPPSYSLDFIFTAVEKLAAEIASGLKSIADAPAKITARLTAADQALEAVRKQNGALLEAGVTYLPFEQKLEAIAAIQGRVKGNVDNDPLGALALCTNLDQSIAALAKELESARQLLLSVNKAITHVSDTRAWVAKVRGTAVTCPWTDPTGEAARWTLSTADTNPDDQLLQAETLLAQAKQSLDSGQLQVVDGEVKQALVVRAQGEKMVKAGIDAKTAVDEQVPRVRAELVTIRGELACCPSGETAQLVERICVAVEGRIAQVHDLYQKQLFPEALTVLTGTSGTEYGLPISKLIPQANELLQLMKKAAQVASTLAKAS